MGETTTGGTGGATAPAECEKCGKPAPAPPAGAPEEPVTHCEWCGAEYPVPPPRP